MDNVIIDVCTGEFLAVDHVVIGEPDDDGRRIHNVDILGKIEECRRHWLATAEHNGKIVRGFSAGPKQAVAEALYAIA